MVARNVAVGFLYHAASGKVLLHLRGADAPPNPGKWAFFGGRGEPEDGGDLLATWRREMREERGAVCRARVVINHVSNVPGGRMRVAYGSGGVLYNPEARQVLLQHRSPDAPTNPNRWGLFGGGAEAVDGGDPVATWRRELREELGIAIEATHVRALGERVRPDGSRRYMFYCEWPALSTDFVLGEGQGFAWFTFEVALALPDLAEGARYYLPRLRERVLAGWRAPIPGD